MNEPMTDEQRKSRKAQRMAIKAASAARKKQKYAVQAGITLDNKPKRLARHLRSNPRDERNASIYIARHSKTMPPKLTSKGRRLNERYAREAKEAA